MKPVLALRHVPHEGLGTIADALAAHGVSHSLLEMWTSSPKEFNPRDWSGLVVMGGPMNVDETDRYPFLADEVHWISQALTAELPVLGVCLGSQLLAKAAGSRVYANGVKEIGWYEIELTPEGLADPLLEGIGSRPTVFQWHGDTFDLPAGAARLASSPQCKNQAFHLGRAAFGLQFHLEVTAELIESWLCDAGNCGELAGLDYIDPAVIRRDTPLKLPPMTSLGLAVFGRFAEMCSPTSARNG